MMGSTGTQWLKTAVRAGGPLAVILLAHLPLVVLHFKHLWQNGLHVHFPVVMTAAGALLWTRWCGKRIPGRWQAYGSTIPLACGFLLLLFGVLIWSPWLGYVAALVTSGAVLLRTCPARVRVWGSAWLLLWLLVPPPMGLDRHLSLELQSYSSRAASLLLDFFHVMHLQNGNVIEIPGMQFSVEEIASGIHSLFALIAAAAILAVMSRRGWLHAICLIALSTGWAGVTNMARVAGMVISAAYFGVDLSTGWRHELWGLALFGIAFGLVLSTDRLLWLLFTPADESFNVSSADEFPEEDEVAPRTDVDSPTTGVAEAEESDESEFNPTPSRLGILQSWTVAGMFACLGLVQSVPKSTAPRQPGLEPPISLAMFEAETLSLDLAGWRRLAFHTERREPGNTLGGFSAIWRYDRDGREAVVSLDFPFSEWHELTLYYRGRGCRMLDWHLEPLTAERLSDQTSQPPFGELAVALIELEQARTASLLFAAWDAEGEMLAPPSTERPSISRLLTDIKHRWTGFGGPDSAERFVFQLQVLSPTPHAPSTDRDLAALRRLFSESLHVLRQRTAGGAR